VDLIDTSLWVDLFRASTSGPVRALVAALVKRPDAALCEPVVFETLRAAPADQRAVIETLFDTMPIVETPRTLWRDAWGLGQRCAGKGLAVPAMDVIIAQVALHHSARLVTFDGDFARIAQVAPLRVEIPERPA